MSEKHVTQEQIARDYQSGTDRDRGQRHGVVVTPVEVVDFINRSIEHLLATEFGVTLADESVTVLDPFTGTGIFPARMLQTAHLTPAEKASLAGRMEAWELDPDAADAARENLATVTRDEAGTDAVPPVVRCLDTFAQGEDDQPGNLDDGRAA